MSTEFQLLREALPEVHVGRLPTMNQDPYPSLGSWWVQLWDGRGDDAKVVARVYGDSPEQAMARAEAMAALTLPAQPASQEQWITHPTNCRCQWCQGKAPSHEQATPDLADGPARMHWTNWMPVKDALEYAYQKMGLEMVKTDAGAKYPNLHWNLAGLVREFVVAQQDAMFGKCQACGKSMGLLDQIKCLDCGTRLCEPCAKEHFGGDHGARAAASHSHPAPTTSGWVETSAPPQRLDWSDTQQATPEPDEEDQWRDVALRFDKHRMQALWHLQAMLQDPAKHADIVRQFLKDPTHPAAATPTQQAAGEPIKHQPGEWYEAKDRDDLETFFRSRLPAIREAAREHGYAIGVHGSMRRDLDLIAAPWRDGASDKDVLAHAIAMAACGITRDGPHQWEQKPLGRVAASLPCCWPRWFNEAGAGHIDLSVTSAQPSREPMTDERLAEVLTTAYGSPEWTMDDVRAARAVEARHGITAPAGGEKQA